MQQFNKNPMQKVLHPLQIKKWSTELLSLVLLVQAVEFKFYDAVQCV
jgi:hypothetical protein